MIVGMTAIHIPYDTLRLARFTLAIMSNGIKYASKYFNTIDMPEKPNATQLHNTMLAVHSRIKHHKRLALLAMRACFPKGGLSR
jgi:hypothetical protein